MKNLNSFKQLFTLLALVMISTQAWGYSSTKLTVNISGSGKVAVTTSNSAPAASAYSASSVSAEQGPHGFFETGVTDSYYVWVLPNTGYKCSGVSDCSLLSNGAYQISFKGSTFTTDKTVTATFVGVSYTIKFNANGGAGSMGNLSMTYATAKNLTANAFTRDCYHFVGWNTQADGKGTSYTDKQSVNNLTTTEGATVTLYAQWAINTYSVVFNGNGSTEGSMSDQAFTYGAAQNLSANAYEKHYTVTLDPNGGTCEAASLTATFDFAGWATAADGEKVYNDAQKVSNLTKTNNGKVNLYALWQNGFVTLPSATATEAYYHLEGWYLGEERVGEAGTVYSPAGNETLRAEWTMEKLDPSFEGDDAELYVGDAQANAFVFNHVENPVPHISVVSIDPINDGSGKVIEYDAATNSIVAVNAGTATIYFEQPAVGPYNAGTSATWTYTVTKKTPVFALAADNLVIDQTTALTLTHVDGAQVTIEPEGSLSFDAEAGLLTALKAGEATITITQEETNAVLASEEVFYVTVDKKTPNLTIVLNGEATNSLIMRYNQTVSFGYKGKVSDAETVEVQQLDGQTYVTYSNGQFASSYGEGVAHFQVAMPETETYKAFVLPFTISVVAAEGYLPVNGAAYTIGSGVETDWRDMYETMSFNGIPDKLSFNFKYIYKSDLGAPSLKCPSYLAWSIDDEKEGQNNVYMLYVEESADGKTWTRIWDDSNPSQNTASSGELQLQKTTRHIRFHHSCNFANSYDNIKVTELRYVEDPVPATIDFGTAAINSGEVSKKTLINWCNVSPMTVTSSNPRFTVSPASFGAYLTAGSQELTISYTHDNIVGPQEATITATNGLNTKTIHVSAVTTKRPQTIQWNETLVATGYAMNVDERFPDEEITSIASAESGELVVFTSDNTDIIEVVDDTILVAKAVGTANITAYQAGDDDYDEAVDTKEFIVSELLKQSIIWEQNLYGLLTTDPSFELVAEATSGGEITYESANTSVVKIVNGNWLEIVGEGETYITATQAGGVIDEQEWLPATARNYVIVRNPASQCKGQALTVNSLELTSSKKSQEYDLSGIPATLTFSAKHDTKSGSWGTEVSYSELIVEQHARINNLIDWYVVYNRVVGTDATASGNITLDESADKIRFRTNESATHTITNVQVSRKKFLRADVEEIDDAAERNAIWSKKITVSHSNIDLMTVTTQEGLFSVSKTTLGEGCGDFGDDEFTVSFTPKEKDAEYYDVIIITDGKADPATIEIPIRLYTTSLNQSIHDFELPETCVVTDEIPAFTATASSGLDVTYFTSDEEIASIVNGNQLKIHAAGTVEVTAYQEGNDRYNEVSVTKTLIITKAPVVITTIPTASDLLYGQTLAESTLTGGHASQAGRFEWLEPETVPATGTHAYTVLFTPYKDTFYDTAMVNVEVYVGKNSQTITWNEQLFPVTVLETAELHASSSAGLDITYTSSDNAIAYMEGNVLHAVSAGTVIITASQAGNDNCEAAESVEREIEIVDIVRITPEIIDPTATSITYGQPLSASQLVDGEAWIPEGYDNEYEDVLGAFMWADTTLILNAGTQTAQAVFVPEDLLHFNIIYMEVEVEVAKASQEIDWVTAVDTLIVGDYQAIEVSATSGLAVTLISDNYDIIEIIDNYTLHALAEGEVLIIARQEGDDNYLAAQQISKAVVVRQEITEEPTALDNTDAANGEWTKVVRDGHIYILRGNKMYNITGMKVE